MEKALASVPGPACGLSIDRLAKSDAAADEPKPVPLVRAPIAPDHFGDYPGLTVDLSPVSWGSY